MNKIKNLPSAFANKRILVIGDLILDKYIFGEVDRISPEAPIPIVKVLKEKYIPGGAANVAANISTLGGQAILMGLLGNDQEGKILVDNLKNFSIDISHILFSSSYNTTLKTRIIGQNQQLLRIDFEKTEYIGKKETSEFISSFQNLEVDVIVISDYAKGLITKKLMNFIVNYTNQKKIPLIIDPKPQHKAWYKNCSLITPNKKEAETISHQKITKEKDFFSVGNKIQRQLNCDVIITAGSNGMYIFPKSKEPSHLHTTAKEVFDVSGAGDTVVATLALALSSNFSLPDSANLANIAAGIKVAKFGTAQVSWKELTESLGK